MRTMPRVLLLLFGMSIVTMMFIARCGLNMDSHGGSHGAMPVSSGGSPGEKALREVMRRKEVEHIRDKTHLQEQIKTLEGQLAKVQGQVKNLTANLQSVYRQSNGNLRDGDNPRSPGEPHLRYPSDGLNPIPANRAHGRPDGEHYPAGFRPAYNPGAFYHGQDFPKNGRNSAEDLINQRNMAIDMNAVDRHALGIDDMGHQADDGAPRAARSAPGESSELQHINVLKTKFNESLDFEKYFQERLKNAEVLKGQSYKTEYELISFNRFIYNRIYLVEPGLGKRVVEKPIGSKKKDLNEIMFHAVETLNKNRKDSGQYKDTGQYNYDDFVEGVYRTDPAFGSQYELYFVNKDDPKRHNSYLKLSVARPFAPPVTVQQTVVSTGPEWINIILPLSKRVDTFRLFMDQFVRVCIKSDKRIYLTVVYFGPEGLPDVKGIMGQVAKTHKFKFMKLVTLNETFARGRGLQIGALNWKGGSDVLMFFCDVDIVFSGEFLERCRLNSERGQRVYYPIVFSLYNPKIVYSLQDVPLPSFQDQLVLSKDTGFWRDFGYGMTCQYRSDFLKIKGFDEQITGWGGGGRVPLPEVCQERLLRGAGHGPLHLPPLAREVLRPHPQHGAVPQLHPVQGAERGVARAAGAARLQGRDRRAPGGQREEQHPPEEPPGGDEGRGAGG
ncbi:chondroitin sulfate N-acetylgalactosaminyltransferase 1-like [Physella acuta]|uniref:chondroitin sulfate N-acetylgalactosaminyltransferase 1-like n=1 Tax=Physella acuta TaxID=109671 RepID=UPI0027DE4AAF|nr:chondroitin sulfate N-acetylgalactosaminyltransferase 1-like [Physella acuta]